MFSFSRPQSVHLLGTRASLTALCALVLLGTAACGAPDESTPLDNGSAEDPGLPKPPAENDVTPPDVVGEPVSNPGDNPTVTPPNEPEGGGQTGGIGQATVTMVSLALDEVGPGGFTAAQSIAAFSGEFVAELVYESGERTAIHFQIAANGADLGADLTVQVAGEHPYLFETWEEFPESSRLVLGADVHFTTSDGKFDETVATVLSVHSLSTARVYFELDPAELQGSYVAPFDAAAAGEEATAAARVRVLTNLGRPGNETAEPVQTSGEMFGSFPTPELLPEVGSADSRLARW